jgi:hypothetical protein
MLELKQRRDIGWDDMSRIEDPFFAKTEIEHYFYQTDGIDSILGLSDVIKGFTDGPLSRDEGTLRQLQDALEWGQIFLLKTDPCHPVVCWEKNNTGQAAPNWAKTQHIHPSIDWIVDSLLTSIQPIRLE